MSSIVANARASPTRSDRASSAALAACAAFGLQMPRTSASRTPTHDWMWNRVMNPLPTKPTPRVFTNVLRWAGSVAGGNGLGRRPLLAEGEQEDDRADDGQHARHEK